MAPEPERHASHLFTVRVWPEEISPGRTEWRSQVAHVLSGETRYVRRWSDLVAFIKRRLPDVAAGLDRQGGTPP